MHGDQDISLLEVGPRDGLRSEDGLLSAQGKVELIACLIRAGLRRIQVTSFVHPRLIPQMVDAEKLIQALPEVEGIECSALILNRTGLERAMATSVDCIEISVSTSTTHSQKNTKMSRQQALNQAQEMIGRSKKKGYAVRGSVQCAFGCVYEGTIDTVCGIA